MDLFPHTLSHFGRIYATVNEELNTEFFCRCATAFADMRILMVLFAIEIQEVADGISFAIMSRVEIVEDKINFRGGFNMGLSKIIYKKSFLVTVGVFLIITIGAFVALSRISEKPSYCVTCHYMTPFYEKWQTSSHNKVACLKCHNYGSWNAMANQLKFFAGSSNPRPRAEVADAKCLQAGCHSMRLVESKVTFKREILFDHKPHFTEIRGGMKLHCASCHYDMVQGNHLAVSEDTCFLCHFRKNGKTEVAVTGCPSCHGAPTKSIVVNGKIFEHRKYLEKGMKCEQCHLQVIEGDGSVPADRCYFCHVDRGSRYNDVEFVHNTHVTKKNIDCHRCHTRIKHGKIKMADNL